MEEFESEYFAEIVQSHHREHDLRDQQYYSQKFQSSEKQDYQQSLMMPAEAQIETDQIYAQEVDILEKKANIQYKQQLMNSKNQKTFKTKNILTNIGTWVTRYMKSVLNSKQKEIFYTIFLSKKSYRGLKCFSKLFNSTLQKYCVQFFTKIMPKIIITSNIKNKEIYFEVLGSLRQGAIKGLIKNLIIKGVTDNN